jgi:F0F1-type ATP synthase epsilon subunit
LFLPRVTFACPNKVILTDAPVHMVSVVTTEGESSFLADHAPFLAQLKPGYVQVFEEAETAEPTHKYFCPAGFAVVKEGSTCTISVTDAIPVEDLDLDAAKTALTAAEAEVAKAGDEATTEAAEAKILVEVYSAMINAGN